MFTESGKTGADAPEIPAVRSRENVRTSMRWDDRQTAGFTTGNRRDYDVAIGKMDNREAGLLLDRS